MRVHAGEHAIAGEYVGECRRLARFGWQIEQLRNFVGVCNKLRPRNGCRQHARIASGGDLAAKIGRLRIRRQCIDEPIVEAQYVERRG